MYIVGTSGHPDRPHSTRHPSLSSHGGNNYRDSSWPLYAMYSKITQEEDNNDAEHSQRDVDGLLVFVSPHVTSTSLQPQLKNRPVYSPPPSRHCLQSQSQNSSLAPRTPRRSTLRTFISFLQTQMHPSGRFRPLWLNPRHSLHRDTLSGLTPSGYWPWYLAYRVPRLRRWNGIPFLDAFRLLKTRDIFQKGEREYVQCSSGARSHTSGSGADLEFSHCYIFPSSSS